MGSLRPGGLLQQEVGLGGQVVLVPDVEDQHCDSRQSMPLECLLCPPLHWLKGRVEHVENCWFAWLHSSLVLIEVKVGF